MKELTADRLRQLLDYIPETGEFRWKARAVSEFCSPHGYAVWQGQRVGQLAGNIRKGRYVGITIDYRAYLAHRLAWLYVHGEWPTMWIDHVDGEPTNNAISNLRLATGTQNQGNRKVSKNCSSGLKGAQKNGDRFVARVKAGSEYHYLGCFGTPEDAHAAYVAGAKKHFGEFACDGRRDT